MDTLHLNGVKTTAPLTGRGQDLIAHAEVTAIPTKCPECGHDKLYDYGRRNIRYVDLPMHGKQVIINLHRQRYHCRNAGCGFTFMPEHPEFDTKFRLTTRAVDCLSIRSRMANLGIPFSTFDEPWDVEP